MDASEDDRRQRPRWTRNDSIALTVVTVIAGLLRAIGIGSPAREVFDEPFYARDACWYVRASAEICKTIEEANLEHPPLGKWLIAAGDAVVGHGPVGWRVAALIAGICTIALTYVFARRLLQSTFAATFAAGVLALDFLHFVHSRIAMLDVFLGLFVIAAFTCLVFDRDDLLAGKRGLRHRPWRAIAGALAGAAIATKWSGALTLVGLGALALAWELTTRRPLSRWRSLVQTIKDEGPGLVFAFVLVPLFVYALSHIGRVHGDLLALPWAEGSWVENFFDRQRFIYSFHLGYGAPNPYAQPPWWWLLLKRPIVYDFQVTDTGHYRQLLGGGNPVVWWLTLPAIAYLTFVWFRHNSPKRPEGAILAGFYWNYLPWIAFAAAPFLFGSGRSAVYVFYVVPMLPFMVTILAAVAQRLVASNVGRAVVGAFVAATIASFVFYYPFLTDRPLSPEQWRRRIWVFDDCARKGDAPIVINSVYVEDGVTRTSSDEIGRAYEPPSGWCWVQMNQDRTIVDWDEILERP